MQDIEEENFTTPVELEKIFEVEEIIEQLQKENQIVLQELTNSLKYTETQEKHLILLQNTIKTAKQCIQENLIQKAENQRHQLELEMANRKIQEMEKSMKNLQIEKEKLQIENVKLRQNVTRTDHLDRELINLISERAAIKQQLEDVEPKKPEIISKEAIKTLANDVGKIKYIDCQDCGVDYDSCWGIH